MGRRRSRSFVPTLGDGLDPRVLLSHGPVPTVSTHQYQQVMSQIDTDFAGFAKASAGSVLLSGLAKTVGIAGGAASVLLEPVSALNSSQDPAAAAAQPQTTPAPQSASQGPVGNAGLLINRVNTAVSRLPRGNSQLVPVIADKVNPWLITPGNATYYRDRVKALVRAYVAKSLRDHTMRCAR